MPRKSCADFKKCECVWKGGGRREKRGGGEVIRKITLLHTERGRQQNDKGGELRAGAVPKLALSESCGGGLNHCGVIPLDPPSFPQSPGVRV